MPAQLQQLLPYLLCSIAVLAWPVVFNSSIPIRNGWMWAQVIRNDLCPHVHNPLQVQLRSRRALIGAAGIYISGLFEVVINASWMLLLP